MSSARSTHSGLGYAGLLMRAEEFFALGETQERYELVNGVVFMSPSARPRHWAIIEEVLLQLRDHARRTGSGLDTYAETDLLIDDLTVFRPDLCVYARPRPARLPERLSSPPDLVLEVLSPGNKPLDLVTKRNTYEKFGVKEYGTIDADDGRIRAWATEGSRWRDTAPAAGALVSVAIPGFVLDLAPIARLVESR